MSELAENWQVIKWRTGNMRDYINEFMLIFIDIRTLF